MDIGTVMSVAQTLLAALQCPQLNEICSIAGYKSKFDELRATVVRIKAVLKDAETKQELSEQEQLYIEELKDAVYEADDLFDEFVTLAERKQLSKGIKVRVLSLFTKFGTAYSMTQGVKKIKNKLDAIADDKRFSLSIDPQPIKNRRLETCSYVYEADIIGRELELEEIVGVLLDSNVRQNVSFLSIVGIGGLGKTALAQLAYNDARVTSAFPLKLWTCVADEDPKSLDVRGVLSKILASTTKHKNHKMFEGCSMDGLQSQLREKLAGTKYLLVLDDVWTENYEQWHTLTKYLMDGQRGSWIVVTTRSLRTVEIIRYGPRLALQGLSKENAWCLFRRVAFGSHHSDLPEDLVKIGQNIVKGCANIPLAIRVVGSLLYGQEKNKWLSIQKLGLAEVEESQISIMPILKLSYYKLESPLKTCFAYCAIFPKDYVIRKETLIRLWIAQGYIPFNDLQRLEDLAEEYFSILLQRCFFQDVKKNFAGFITCKIHDLMHDVAQEVVGKEICTIKSMDGDIDKKVRHLSLTQSESSKFVSNKTHIRSYLHVDDFFKDKNLDQFYVDALIANWKYLRALDLSRSNIKSLPGSIGDLIHLRYLDLGDNNELEALPESITKLYNLQTLVLSFCKLKVLPKDLRKLVKLRILQLGDSDELKYMPRGMGMLTCLHNLDTFIVGGMSLSTKEVFDELEDLKALTNLRGFIDIRIQFMKTSTNTYKKINGGREGGCLGNKEHLKEVSLSFVGDEDVKGREEYDEAMMEALQPKYTNLTFLVVEGYRGVRIPNWVREDNLATIFPNLNFMKFEDCLNLQYLGHLWLPRLETVMVENCPNLTGILECPAINWLYLTNFNDRLEIINIVSNLKEVRIDNLAWLDSLRFQSGANKANMKSFACLSALKVLDIQYSSNSSLSMVAAVRELPFCHSLLSLTFTSVSHMPNLPNWISHLTALQSLDIWSCKEVESMPNWMSKLTSLRELRAYDCSARLRERCQESTGEDWPHIQQIPNISIL